MNERIRPAVNARGTELDTDRIARVLVKMTVPAFLGMFVQAGYNVINTIFVGQYVGTDAIAALSIVFPLQMIIIGLGAMVGIGGLSVISRSIGAGDYDNAERTLGNALTVGVIIAFTYMLIILPFADFWLRLIGASESVLPYARTYLFIVIGGTVFGTLGFGLLNLVRAEGNARVPMIAMVSGALLSIVLSAVFIGWLKMGVLGAGLATVAAQILSFVYLLSYYFRGRSFLKVRKANFKPDLKVLKPLLSIGAASFLQPVAGSISGMILIHSVVSYGGDIALSAWGIFQRIFMFVTIPTMAIGQGLQPVLGFNYGAGRHGLGLKAIYLALWASTVFSAVTFVLVYLFPEPMFRVFRDDPLLIETGTYVMRLAFLGLPLVGLIMVSQMIFQALGKAVQSFTIALARPIVFLIPLLFFLSSAFELDGVFLSFPVTDGLTLILVIILVRPIISGLRKAAETDRKEAQAPNPVTGMK